MAAPLAGAPPAADLEDDVLAACRAAHALVRAIVSDLESAGITPTHIVIASAVTDRITDVRLIEAALEVAALWGAADGSALAE